MKREREAVDAFNSILQGKPEELNVNIIRRREEAEDQTLPGGLLHARREPTPDATRMARYKSESIHTLRFYLFWLK